MSDEYYEDDYEDDFEDDEDPYADAPKTKRSPAKSTPVRGAPPSEQDPAARLAAVNLGSEKKSNVNMETIEFGDVELNNTIGGGGAGLVYAGKYKGKHVAVKTLIDPRLSDTMVSDFAGEAQLLASLDHPNIIKFYAACLRPPKLCIVSELCARTVFDIIHGGRGDMPLDKGFIWKVAMDTAQAFRYLHDDVKPIIIHRDLKSHNLLLNNYDPKHPEKCETKLCDFGLAREETQKGMGGTPAYMPPELLTNSEYDERVDVYAYGILLFEMFSREVPFDGYPPAEIRRKVLKGERPTIPAHTPREWQKIIKDCWHQDRLVRPRFSGVIKKLEAIKKDMDDILSYDIGDIGDCLDSFSNSRPTTSGARRR